MQEPLDAGTVALAQDLIVVPQQAEGAVRRAQDRRDSRRAGRDLGQLARRGAGHGVAVGAVQGAEAAQDFEVDPTRMTASEFSERLLKEHGVRIGDVGPRQMRAVTHLDVAGADIPAALRAVEAVLAA